MSTLDQRVTDLVLQYAPTPPRTPLVATLSLRRDLSIDSLSLVSLTLRLGDELNVDLIERGVDLSHLDTVGDLIALAHSLFADKGGDHEREPSAARG
jgi:acyl carrier protein